MTDREKVLTWLEICGKNRDCSGNCPYSGPLYGEDDDSKCREDLMADALALLKEQEAKTGTWQWKIHGKPESGGTLGEAVCDQCGKSTYATAVKGTLNYCPNCGANMMDRR